jgi:hypothetical protein
MKDAVKLSTFPTHAPKVGLGGFASATSITALYLRGDFSSCHCEEPGLSGDEAILETRGADCFAPPLAPLAMTVFFPPPALGQSPFKNLRVEL